MRIISGKHRGRPIVPPRNLRARPTTDFAKENLFNVLNNLLDFEEIDVLDLFAGTGQLGLEALSRGAEGCVFVDQRREAAALVRENVKLCRFEDRAQVVQGDAQDFLRACRERFDVVFLDPPYKTDLLDQCVEKITRFDILREHGIIVCESGTEWAIPTPEPPYEAGREYRYGQIKLSLCRRTGSVIQ